MMLIASRSRCLVGKRRKAAPGSAAFQPCSTSGHGVQRPAGFPFRSTNGAAAPGEVWAVARQTGPRRTVPMVLLYAVFATHPQRGEYSRPPLAPAVIAPQHRRPRGEAGVCRRAPPQVRGRAWAFSRTMGRTQGRARLTTHRGILWIPGLNMLLLRLEQFFTILNISSI